MEILNRTDHDRVSRAISSAEETTSGEIYCVLAHSSDSYFYPAALMVSIAILFLGTMVAFVLHSWWMFLDLRLFCLAQLLAMLVLFATLWFWPALRIKLVPRSLCYRRAHANAQAQFLAHNIHATGHRTGVLLFLSLGERYGEVIADSAINAKVPQEKWNAIVDILISHARENRIADGFVNAVETTGTTLAIHFPPQYEQENTLEDRLVELLFAP